MSKEKSPAYQHYPKDILSDINYQMMNWSERGMYRHLMDICWLEKSIPSDFTLLARILNLSDQEFKGAWKMIAVCFKYGAENSQLIHPRLEKEREKQAEWSEKSAIGGRNSAHKRKHTKKKTSEQGGCDLVGTKSQPKVNTASSSSFPSSSSIATAKEKSIAASQASPPGDASPVPSEFPSGNKAKERPKDEAYETFAREFTELRQTPYRPRKGDFVQLASLRKDLNCNCKGIPHRWGEAIGNYFASPLKEYTLADLCVRFDIFLQGEVDRYGRQAGFNDVRQANKATAKSLQEKGFFDE
jgi:uncharacterized protein YdaU (DUF1376 family)